jgi:broad-specificity NMP kinase
MIVWINGTFGVGKSTTAAALVEWVSGYRLFDREHVGYMLMANLKGVDFDDFQDLAAWRALVPVVARHVHVATGQQLVAVQTVIDREYWTELRSGLEAEGFDVMHVLLDAEAEALVGRIRSDEHERDAEQWRLEHLGPYFEARTWLVDAADVVVDVSTASVDHAVEQIADALVRAGLAPDRVTG